jgi:putative arylsulfatase
MIGKSLDIGSSVIRFFSKNFYTLILFALVLISAFSSIWLFYFEIVKDTNPLSSIPAHIVKTLFDAMVLMSPFFVVKRRGFVFIPLILLDVFCLSAVWYYRNYLDIIPFSSFLLYENLTPLLLESAFASARWIDCLAIVPTLMTGVLYKFVLRKISGITSKNGRNDAKRLNINVVTVSDDDKPRKLKKQRKAEYSRRTVC